MIVGAIAYAGATLRASSVFSEAYVECTNAWPPPTGWLGRYLGHGLTSTSMFEFLTQRDFLLTSNTIISLLILYVTVSSMLVITIQLDFGQGLLVAIVSCVAMLWALMEYQMDLKADFLEYHYLSVKLSHPMFAMLVFIPVGLILMALYSSDRIARNVYWAKLQAERDNTSLKANLTTTNPNLIYEHITENEHKDVHQILAFDDSHGRMENSVLEAVSIPFEHLTFESVIGVSVVTSHRR